MISGWEERDIVELCFGLRTRGFWVVKYSPTVSATSGRLFVPYLNKAMVARLSRMDAMWVELNVHGEFEDSRLQSACRWGLKRSGLHELDH